jgi:hypothetical protein
LDRRYGSQFAMVTMEADQLVDVYIGNAVTVCKTKCFVTDKIPHPFEASAGKRVLSVSTSVTRHGSACFSHPFDSFIA